MYDAFDCMFLSCHVRVRDRITKDKKTLQQNISETVINEPGIPKERYISPEKIQKIIYDLRFK